MPPPQTSNPMVTAYMYWLTKSHLCLPQEACIAILHGFVDRLEWDDTEGASQGTEEGEREREDCDVMDLFSL